MNIAILHGCRQSDEMMKSLMREYEKKIKAHFKDATFYYINAQYPHVDTGRMWFSTHLDLERIGTDDIPEKDIMDTMKYVSNIITTNNINVLIGFSQGGNVISSYLRLFNQDKHIKCAIIISGYDFPRYQHLPIEIPLLFIGSKEDIIVDIKLKPVNCIDITEMEHSKGHIINQQKSFITSIVNWLSNK